MADRRAIIEAFTGDQDDIISLEDLAAVAVMNNLRIPLTNDCVIDYILYPYTLPRLRAVRGYQILNFVRLYGLAGTKHWDRVSRDYIPKVVNWLFEEPRPEEIYRPRLIYPGKYAIRNAIYVVKSEASNATTIRVRRERYINPRLPKNLTIFLVKRGIISPPLILLV
jgi:hypothetical protein